MNEEFISGEWYEESYKNHDRYYHRQYIQEGIPKWAVETNAHYVDYIAMIHNLPPGAKVLDCGSGLGFFINAWKRRGYDVRGVEIASRPIMLSEHRRLITQASVADLSMFKDDEFDLVVSVALLEHIDESILYTVLSEMWRVGLRQSHLIGIGEGDDPSHINMKTRDAWVKIFSEMNNKTSKYEIVFVTPTFVDPEDIGFLNASYLDLLPYPMRRFIYEMNKREKEGL